MCGSNGLARQLRGLSLGDARALIRVGLWGIVTTFFNRDAMPFELCCCPVLSSSFDDCMRHGQNFMGFYYYVLESEGHC